MKKLLTLFLLGLSTFGVSAQWNGGTQVEFLFGYMPNPRADAMGQADVAVGGDLASYFHNPAGIGLIQRAEFAFSTWAPYYVLKKSDNFFFGGAWKVHPRIAAALTVNMFAVGPTTFDITINGNRYPLDRAITTLSTLTFTGSPINGLHIGVNLGLYRSKYIEMVPASHHFNMDLGILYTFYLKGNDADPQQGIRFGAGFNNVTSADLPLQEPDGTPDVANMPNTGRYGITYFNNRLIRLPGSGEGGLGMMITFEVQDVLNYDYYTAFRLGSEIMLYNIFALRLGMYSFNVDDKGFANNKDRISTMTYGFGVLVPIEQWTNGSCPVQLSLDFTAFKQPRFTKSGSYIPVMRNMGIRCVWTPKTAEG